MRLQHVHDQSVSHARSVSIRLATRGRQRPVGWSVVVPSKQSVNHAAIRDNHKMRRRCSWRLVGSRHSGAQQP